MEFGGLGILVSAVIGLVVVGLIGAFGLQMMSESKTDMCESGFTYNSGLDTCTLNSNTSKYASTAQLNATKDSIDGVAKIPAKLPLIAGVIVIALVIALLVRYFRD